VIAGESEQVHRAGRDNERLRRVKSPQNSQHKLADATRLQAFNKTLNLNLISFETPLIALQRIRRNVGEAFVLALQQQTLLKCSLERELNRLVNLEYNGIRRNTLR
jgi:hypothetical protein